MIKNPNAQSTGLRVELLGLIGTGAAATADGHDGAGPRTHSQRVDVDRPPGSRYCAVHHRRIDIIAPVIDRAASDAR